MAEEVKTPQENEATTVEKSPEKAPAEEKAPTMAEIQKQAEVQPPKEAKTEETVGLPKYMEEKKRRQAVEKKLADLEASIKDGGVSKEDLTDDLESLTKEYEDVDPQFLGKLVSSIERRIEKKFEGRINEAVEPLKESAQEKRINDAFQTHFDKAMESMPEYKDLVDANVIKTLSLDPTNEDKTFPELIEETYGKFVTGRKTMEEKTTPGGGKEPESVDFARAKKDPAYFSEIMKNPRLKAEYNKDLPKRIGS